MDRSLGTPAAPRIKDVSDQILDSHLIYGASDNMQPRYASANRSLNYHTGGSIHRAEQERVQAIPFTLKYQDVVGLFGKENHFVKVNVNIDTEHVFACFEEPGWECAIIRRDTAEEIKEKDPYYEFALVTGLEDPIRDGIYEDALVGTNKIKRGWDAWVSVELKNLKTGNKYIDAWLDVRLYNSGREEHAYDKMYVKFDDHFYIGFHARNTRRLPYNVEVTVGQDLYNNGLPDELDRYKNRTYRT